MQQTVLNQRYRLLNKIGEGGMAEVFRAEDALLERTVAVKILREQYAADPDFLARFVQEARSAARVAHPSIVSVFDVGSDGDSNYIVMEHVEGPNLKTLIREGAPLGLARAVEIAVEILAALSFAHQKGLIHRDVKPQNILVGPDGQVKVADFGIARAANTPQLTTAGVVLATVQYCSPEQAMGKAATAASDIYSVGVVLYEMLTGALPFEAESAVAVALKHLQEPPRPPRELNPLIPRQLEAIVLRALAKEPERRFQTAADMRQALRTYQQFGEEATATFAPVAAPDASGPASAPAAPKGRAGRGAVVRARPPSRGGIDWLAVVLGVLVFFLVAGAVPLALRVYSLYFDRQPEPTQTAAPVKVQPAPTFTASPATPTPTVPAAAQSTPSPTAPAETPTPRPTVTVPKLEGKPFEQARLEAEGAGLQIRIAGESPSASHEPSVVLAQSPPPETGVMPGAMIEVVLSRGPERLVVELVVGSKLADAREKLVAAGFDVQVADQFSDQVPAGVVAAQKPEPGEFAARGSTVALVVSKGPPPPTPVPTVRPPEGDWAWVPEVGKLPEAEARKRIEQAGLQNTFPNYQVEADVPEALREYFRSVPPGHVLSTSPNAGERVPKGSMVRIAVRKP